MKEILKSRLFWQRFSKYLSVGLSVLVLFAVIVSVQGINSFNRIPDVIAQSADQGGVSVPISVGEEVPIEEDTIPDRSPAATPIVTPVATPFRDEDRDSKGIDESNHEDTRTSDRRGKDHDVVTGRVPVSVGKEVPMESSRITPKPSPTIIHPSPSMHLSPLVVHPSPKIVHPSPIVSSSAPVASPSPTTVVVHPSPEVIVLTPSPHPLPSPQVVQQPMIVSQPTMPSGDSRSDASSTSDSSAVASNQLDNTNLNINQNENRNDTQVNVSNSQSNFQSNRQEVNVGLPQTVPMMVTHVQAQEVTPDASVHPTPIASAVPSFTPSPTFTPHPSVTPVPIVDNGVVVTSPIPVKGDVAELPRTGVPETLAFMSGVLLLAGWFSRKFAAAIKGEHEGKGFYLFEQKKFKQKN